MLDSNKMMYKYFHWFYYQCKKHYYFNFSIGILIWIFQGINLPFNSGVDNTTNFFILLFILFPFAISWPLMSYAIDFFIKYSFKLDAVKKARFTYKVLIVKVLLFIHLALVLKGLLCYWNCIYLSVYLQLWLYILLVVGLVYFFFSLIAKKQFFHADLDENRNTFTFIGSGKKSIHINLEMLIYIKSDDNYVEFVSIDTQENLRTELFRTTLDSVVKQLIRKSEFVRIHRSYIVNMRYVSEYKNHNIVIKHNDLKMEFSVSKTYQNHLKEFNLN